MTTTALVALALLTWVVAFGLRGTATGRSDRLGAGIARALALVVAPALTLLAVASLAR